MLMPMIMKARCLVWAGMPFSLQLKKQAGQWYWQQGDGSWVEYDRDKSDEIEAAFLKGKRRVRVVRSSAEFMVLAVPRT